MASVRPSAQKPRRSAKPGWHSVKISNAKVPQKGWTFPKPTHRIPAEVKSGVRLQNQRLLEAMAKDGVLETMEGEKLHYYYQNNPEHPTDNCIFLTNFRFMKTDNGRLYQSYLLSDLLHVVHKKTSVVTHDELVLTSRTSFRETVKIWGGPAASFFTSFLKLLVITNDPSVPETHLEGTLQKRGEVNTTWKKRYFVFAGDSVEYYKNKTGFEQNMMMNSIPLTGALVQSIDESVFHRPHLFGINVEMPEEKKNRTFILDCGDAKNHDAWVSNLERVAAELTPEDYRQREFPALFNKKNKHEKDCCICHVKFTLTNRRHHCRRCGKAVCQTHSSRKKHVDGQKAKVRVCDKCFDPSFVYVVKKNKNLLASMKIFGSSKKSGSSAATFQPSAPISEDAETPVSEVVDEQPAFTLDRISEDESIDSDALSSMTPSSESEADSNNDDAFEDDVSISETSVVIADSVNSSVAPSPSPPIKDTRKVPYKEVKKKKKKKKRRGSTSSDSSSSSSSSRSSSSSDSDSSSDSSDDSRYRKKRKKKSKRHKRAKKYDRHGRGHSDTDSCMDDMNNQMCKAEECIIM